jgi:cation:H+ antiporter
MLTLAILNMALAECSSLLLVLILIVGLIGLTFGGDWLTAGAAAISVNLKINPVVVGLTVVSIATSMPEMMTSLIAASESPGLAVGNILGSNIANIGLILGVTAIILPLSIQSRLIQREVPILLIVTVLFVLFSIGGFARWEGLVLLVLTVAYLYSVVRDVRRESAAAVAEFSHEAEKVAAHSTPHGLFLLVLGALLLALGADLLVNSSVELASRMGISDTLIGLTIVALGTSLPELAACVAAARAGHSDICAGNIVGSNLFNIMLIGGGVAAINPIPVDAHLMHFEFPALIGLTALLLLVFKTAHSVSRKEGTLLIFLYFAILSVSAWAQIGDRF